MIQKYVNHWFTHCLDLFGGEISSNAAEVFAASLKGRFQEERRTDDHVLLDQVKTLMVPDEGGLIAQEIPMRRALNEVLREDYRDDCLKSVARWNKTLALSGVDFRLTLPSTRFNRHQGIYAGHRFDPAGEPIDESTWATNRDTWLPTAADDAALRAVMHPVTEPGKVANWIAPPRRGIDDRPAEFEYVRFH